MSARRPVTTGTAAGPRGARSAGRLLRDARTHDPDKLALPPTWACASEAVGVCLYRPNRRRVVAIALVVGSLLVAINQGGILASGHLGWIVWLRMALDYLIPACVSTMGVLAGSRRIDAQ